MAYNSNATSNAPIATTSLLPARATITAWCALSGMGRSTTYEALGRGDLRAVKLGSRTLIDVSHGLAWLDTLPPATVGHRATSSCKQDI